MKNNSGHQIGGRERRETICNFFIWPQCLEWLRFMTGRQTWYSTSFKMADIYRTLAGCHENSDFIIFVPSNILNSPVEQGLTVGAVPLVSGVVPLEQPAHCTGASAWADHLEHGRWQQWDVGRRPQRKPPPVEKHNKKSSKISNWLIIWFGATICGDLYYIVHVGDICAAVVLTMHGIHVHYYIWKL